MRELLRTTRDAEEFLLSSVQTFAALKPDPEDLKRFMGIALNCLDTMPALLKCTQQSFRNSLIECARLGLEPMGALGHCYLIPYGEVCTVQVGYKGLVQLIQRDGGVQGVWGHVVYEDEVKEGRFVVHEGTEHSIVHDRDPFHAETTEGVVGAYACFRLPSGKVEFDTMGILHILDLKEKSRGSGKPDSPWNTYPLEMYKKCPIKRGSKRVPQLKSDAWERFLRLEENQGVAPEPDPVIDVGLKPRRAGDGDAVIIENNPKTYLKNEGSESIVVTQEPEAESREQTNERLCTGWRMYTELGGETDELHMDRNFDDYLKPEITSDSEAILFRDRLIRAVQRRKREK